MSQKREKEETIELKVPVAETLPTLCSDNCNISATANTESCAGSSSPESARIDLGHPPPPPLQDEPHGGAERRDPEPNTRHDDATAATTTLVMKKAVNRCSGCGKRVGLTGFRCRCRELFCSVHRYSDRHDCSYDYKASGREAIARENPVVRAAKILKV